MTTRHGPERPGGQGLDPNQEESGNRAILALLRDPEVAEHVDLVITQRDDAYEVWARARHGALPAPAATDGHQRFRIVEQIGENPIADQRHDIVATCAEELRAAGASGHPTDGCQPGVHRARRSSATRTPTSASRSSSTARSRRISSSARSATPSACSPASTARSTSCSRAPRSPSPAPASGPGSTTTAPRHVDVAPTICRLLGFPLHRRHGLERPHRQRARRRARTSTCSARTAACWTRSSPATRAPERAYLVIFDGLSNSELQWLLDRDDPGVANLRRLLDRSARFRFGSTVNFPTITWPSHSALFTGAWCGHHDIVNPTYYDRAARQPLAPQGQAMMTETLPRRRRRDAVRGVPPRPRRRRAFTASIHEPQGRGADHAPLEGRVVGPRDRLKALTAEFVGEINPRWLADGHEGVHREALLDARGLAQALVLFDDPTHPPPVLMAHEFTLTDGAGHEYGPHSDGLRDSGRGNRPPPRRRARSCSRRRDCSTRRCSSSPRSRHGGAGRRAGSQSRAPSRAHRHEDRHRRADDLAARPRRQPSSPPPTAARRGSWCCDNDADTSGEKPPIAGAEVRVLGAREQRGRRRCGTNAAGIAGFATPADVAPRDLVVSVHHSDYNPRHLRLDGTNLAIDLRSALYGKGGIGDQ